MDFKLKYRKGGFLPRVLHMRFDVYAWIMACEARGLEFPDVAFKSELEARVSLMYGGYVSYCRCNSKRVKLSLNDVYAIYKAASIEEMDRMSMAIAKTKILGKQVIEYASEGKEEKKN